MLCPKCGSNCGDEIRLCPKCAEAKKAEYDAEVAEAEASAEEASARHESYDHDFSDAPNAGFWLRFCAHTIDAVIVSIPTWILALMAGSILNALVSNFKVESATSLGFLLGFIMSIFVAIFAVLIILYVLTIVYFVAFECSQFCATPGKMFVGLVVTDFDGSRLSFGRALARNFCKGFSGILFLFGFAMAGFTANKQALHDLIAGTLVVRRQIKPLGPIIAVTVFAMLCLMVGNSVFVRQNGRSKLTINVGGSDKPVTKFPVYTPPAATPMPTPVPTPVIEKFSGPHVHVESRNSKIDAQSIVGFYYAEGSSITIGVYASELNEKELAHIRSIGALATTPAGQVPILTISVSSKAVDDAANSAAKNYLLYFKRDPISHFDYEFDDPTISLSHAIRGTGSDLFQLSGDPRVGGKIRLKVRGEGGLKWGNERFGWDIDQEVLLLEPK